MMEGPDESEDQAMGLVRRASLMATVAICLFGATTGMAQTVSQKCVDAVQHKFPEASTAWVVTALTKGEATELRWKSTSGLFGTCTMSPSGIIQDVRSSGRQKPDESKRIDPVEYADFEAYTIECASTDGERNECPVEGGAVVELIGTQGDADCILDTSWGHVENLVWVDDGCHGEFSIRSVRRPLQTFPEGPEGAKDLRSTVSAPELRTLKGRAEQACLREVAGRGVEATHHYGTRTEGEYIVVFIGVRSAPRTGFMGAEPWAPKGDVTCRYNPANDRAVIAR
jgi:hypothetical protein